MAVLFKTMLLLFGRWMVVDNVLPSEKSRHRSNKQWKATRELKSFKKRNKTTKKEEKEGPKGS